MRDWLAPHIVFPVYERVSGRRPWTALRRLRELQWRSPEALEARAFAKLRPLLAHAYAHVPYYRELFARAGVGPEDIRTVADLSRLPLTGKAELRANFPHRLVADNLPARRRVKRCTSGSTGLPFELYVDRASFDVRDASWLLSLEWAGVAHAHAVFRVRNPPPPPAGPLAAWRLRDGIRRILLGRRTVWLAGWEATAAEFLDQLSRLPRGCAYYIQGYPSYIARLAGQLLQTGAELPIYPAGVITGAETQTAPDVAAIRRAFRCPIVNRYASVEMDLLAQTCPDAPTVLHTNSECAIVRVVRKDGRAALAGESGRVVVTDLGNWVMPFINYDIGDRAVAGVPCPCGRGFPTLLGLDGRAAEVVRTPAGKVVLPAALDWFLMEHVRRALHCVWEYQAVQTAADAVVIRIVPLPAFTAAFAGELETKLRGLLGSEMRVQVETVGRIPVEPSGKRLVIKSELPP